MQSLCNQLKFAATLDQKHKILDAHPEVERKKGQFAFLFETLSSDAACVLKQLFLLDQPLNWDERSIEKWTHLLQSLVKVDQFYSEMGGLIGYQETVLQLLKKDKNRSQGDVRYHSPSFIDLRGGSAAFQQGVQWGLEAMPFLAELYPLGGAADRLHLVDADTGEELPAAKLPFAGRPLLETLIRDVQAREHLYYREFGKQVLTPIAMMTSWEKENHRHVLALCEEHRYWGRPRELFRFFSQPLVPAVDLQGKWIMIGPLQPLLKPGGHGVLWKLARDAGIFDWFASHGRKHAIIRQINNPAAGMDGGLLALSGIGAKGNYRFGFASCPRLVNSAEGMNVLIERGDTMVLSNVEYCEFEQAGISDIPMSEESPYSRFSSNTNILFADLASIQNAVAKEPFPGLLINPKPAQIKDLKGESRQAVLGRLESTMQNIADVFSEERTDSLKTKHTFATYNERNKTIAVAKKAYVPEKSLLETPEHCFHELLVAARELLESCSFSVPPMRSLEDSLKQGPSFVFLYHPALGPLYSHVRQRLQGGSIALGSELSLEIADLLLQNVQLNGSLQIQAHQVMGHADPSGHLHYSNSRGTCRLKNVTVENLGVDWVNSSPHWRRKWVRKETLTIELQGTSCFEAEGVRFIGGHHFVVRDGVKMTVREIQGKLQIEESAWSGGSPLQVD